MALSDAEVRRLALRINTAKNTVSVKYPFFGFLLGYLDYALDDECETACTDGRKIIFGTDFLSRLDEDEVVFVLLHEIMHCVLNHLQRKGSKDTLLYNIAADIVVNSLIFESIGCSQTVDGEVPMHLTPGPFPQEGRLYSTEEVYEMLLEHAEHIRESLSSSGKDGGGAQGGGAGTDGKNGRGGSYRILDDHSLWKESDTYDDFGVSQEEWEQRMSEAAHHAKSCGRYGHIPEGIRNYLDELESHEVDWRTALHNFCRQIESFDYSWQKGDRRYTEKDIFLPEYTLAENGEVEVKDLLFFIDTSGSVSNEEVSVLLAEIRSAIALFDNRLAGKLGFFDAEVIEPVDFTDEASFRLIRPKGGGGTDFGCIFRYVEKKYEDNPPAAIIIMTDGYAPFPDESAANGIPVLWIINSGIRAPWGETIRISNP